MFETLFGLQQPIDNDALGVKRSVADVTARGVGLDSLRGTVSLTMFPWSPIQPLK